MDFTPEYVIGWDLSLCMCMRPRGLCFSNTVMGPPRHPCAHPPDGGHLMHDAMLREVQLARWANPHPHPHPHPQSLTLRYS